jgi:hypothetical protein
MAEPGSKTKFYSGGDPVATRVIIMSLSPSTVQIITLIIQKFKLVAGVGFEPTTFRL